MRNTWRDTEPSLSHEPGANQVRCATGDDALGSLVITPEDSNQTTRRLAQNDGRSLILKMHLLSAQDSKHFADLVGTADGANDLKDVIKLRDAELEECGVVHAGAVEFQAVILVEDEDQPLEIYLPERDQGT